MISSLIHQCKLMRSRGLSLSQIVSAVLTVFYRVEMDPLHDYLEIFSGHSHFKILRC